MEWFITIKLFPNLSKWIDYSFQQIGQRQIPLFFELIRATMIFSINGVFLSFDFP